MGLEDFEEQAFMLHLLRPGDLFVDVGANVGAYSLLASGVCGASSLAIEPIPDTFSELVRNICVNRLSKLANPQNLGIGSCSGKLTFTTQLDTMNRVIEKKDIPFSNQDTIDVDVLSLDELLAGLAPVLLKIDVEGFEQEILQGAQNTLRDPNLAAILIELIGNVT